MIKVAQAGDLEISTNLFPVVGIGASAGGLEAVKQFLKAIPEKSGMAFVFVQHLSPTHKSVLPEILKKSSKIPVHLITDNIHLEQDNLYIIPENKILTATDGVLKLAPLDDLHHQVKIIDLFFFSLAVVHQSYAVGVVLSGYLDDGTLGLQAIKTYGGITFAQDEESAEFDNMPKMAINKGVVDFILSPAKIAEHLLAINLPFHTHDLKPGIVNTLPEADEEVFKHLLTILRTRRRVDFTSYKTSTLKRRIIRRMALNNMSEPTEYLEYLNVNKPEQDALYNDMLISVTNFFRDPESFKLLCTSIFPDLEKQKKDDEPIRIWIAGCATGEEAYSMAICLQEQLGDKAAAMKIQVFASDISETAIAKARRGIYRPTDMEGLSPSRLEQFFTRVDGNYEVNKSIRDLCVFANHNLLTDPPFSKMDLISCRNVLIYLEPVLQNKALTTFHYALNDQGFLLLGKAETVGVKADLFSSYNNQEKIFRKKGVRGRFMPVTSKDSEQNIKNADKRIQKEDLKKDVFRLTDELILASYSPVGVLINENFDIIQFRGETDAWLTLTPGKATLNLLKMARDGLAFELRNLLHIAKRTNASARKEDVVFQANHLQHYVTMDVSPIKGVADPHYLVLFEPGKSPGLHLPLSISGKSEQGNARSNRIEKLENELIRARADMKTVTEEQENLYEALQGANQELLSGSEELQTLNEELETSKEELQSTNEEIITVNNELLDRNEQLNNAQTYTEGIINTIGDPLIVLDSNLKVMRATTGFYNKFKVNEKDTEGQYLYDLGNQQWDIPALRNLLESILPEKKVVSNFEVTHVFPSIGECLMNLNARQLERPNGDQLILLAIEDISDKRRIESGLAEVEKLFIESKERLRFAVDSARLGTWDYNPITGKLMLDSSCKSMFGILPSEEIDFSHFLDVIHPDDRERTAALLQEVLAGKDKKACDTEFRTIESKDTKSKWLQFKGEAFYNAEQIAYRFIGTVLDITVQKIIENANLELLRKKDEFISVASHELKTPVTTLKSTLQIIERSVSRIEDMKQVYPFLQKAIRQVNKLTVLINDLLDVTKIQRGKLELNETSFVIKELIEECADDLLHYSSEHEIKIECETGLTVFADRHRIEQVIINLISNALKYSPKGKKVIIRAGKQQADTVKIEVTDFGIGISKDKIPLVFDRFYRVEETSQNYAGIGLGLYISSEIIKHHKGSIGIESKIGKGSTFWFTIPGLLALS